MGDFFQQAQSVAAHDTLCYVNSDIILLADFPQAVERIARFREKFLMVGRRLDLDLAEPLQFDANGWEASLRSRALGQGTMNIARSIDYFVFPRNLYPPLPEMALGRFWWDNWLIWKAYALGAAVVDATAVVLAIHQNHTYSHYAGGREAMLAGEEATRNCRLGCETNPADFENGLHWRYFYTIDDATHVLSRGGIKPTSRHTWKMVKRTLGNPRSLPALIRQTLAGARYALFGRAAVLLFLARPVFVLSRRRGFDAGPLVHIEEALDRALGRVSGAFGSGAPAFPEEAYAVGDPEAGEVEDAVHLLDGHPPSDLQLAGLPAMAEDARAAGQLDHRDVQRRLESLGSDRQRGVGKHQAVAGNLYRGHLHRVPGTDARRRRDHPTAIRAAGAGDRFHHATCSTSVTQLLVAMPPIE